MSLFKKKEKIHHVNHLPEAMRKAIKTLIDSSIPDVAKAYGFKYLTPRIGEPFFVPFSELDGKFKDTRQAYETILTELRLRREEAMNKFREWYPNAKEIEHFRFTFYSYVDPREGMDFGIGANPLASLPEGEFKLGEIEGIIREKDVVSLTPALAGYVANGNSPLNRTRSFKFLDPMVERKEEIIEAYMWASETFHAKYDKENDYDPVLGKYYMERLFEIIDQEVGKYRADKVDGEVALVPVFMPFAGTSGKRILEAWKSSPEFVELIDEGRFYDLSVVPLVLNLHKVKELVEEAKKVVNTVVILSDKKMHPIANDNFLDLQGKVVVDKEFVKVIELR